MATNHSTRRMHAYLLAIGCAGWVLLAVLLWERAQAGVSWGLAWRAGFFLGLAVLVGLQPVRLPRGATTTVGFAVDYACLVIFGPAVAAVIGVLSFAVLLRRSPLLRQFFNQGQVILTFAGAGWVYQGLGGRFIEAGPLPQPVPFGEIGLALVGCGVAAFSISTFLISVAIGQAERRSVLGVWIVTFRWTGLRFLALAPFGVLMAMVYQVPALGIVAVGLLLVPLVGARWGFQGAMERLQVHRETVEALAKALETYDEYTRGHSEAVASYALAMGRELDLPAPRLEMLEWACWLHDMGKCRQDWESIIAKPGKPSPQEWEVIRQHPVLGSQLVEQLEFLPHTAGEVARIVRAHHERLDGSGYPDGQRGEAICLEARVLAVADAFEAMIATRAYKPQRSPEEALAELQRCAGTQFDPRAVAALTALYARGELEVGQTVEQRVEPVALGLGVPAGEAAGGAG
jgi:putative nucleotidyltransferase with HDIG domain